MERATYLGAVYMDLLEQVSDGVYFVSTERRITYWNSGAERLTGYTAAEVLGRRCSAGLLRHVDDTGGDMCHAGCPLAAVMADGTRRSADVFLHHKAGHRVAVTVRGHPLTDTTGRVVGDAEVFAERRDSAYADLGRRSPNSSQDPVTGLPGRALGEARPSR